MANGSGLAIAGIIIGIVVATQVSNVESADVDVPDVNSTADEDVNSTGDEDADSTSDEDADSTGQEVPTQIDAGLPGVEIAEAVTSVERQCQSRGIDLFFRPGPCLHPADPRRPGPAWGAGYVLLDR